MKSVLLFASLMLVSALSSATTSPAFNPKEFGADAQVVTRALDLLLAREEMKQALPPGFKLAADDGPSSSEIDRKVRLLTSTMALEDCVIDLKDTRSPDGKNIDSVMTYQGGRCPVAVKAVVHVVSENNAMNGTVEMRLDVVNEALKNELDIYSAVIPATLSARGEQGPGGFEIAVKMQISSRLQSRRFGVVDYTSSSDTRVSFADFSQRIRIDELLSSTAGRVAFGQVIYIQASGEQTTAYLIDGRSVTKAEFDERHANVAIPGFDNTVEPLERPHTCELALYDSRTYTLDGVRALMKAGKLGTIPAAERFSDIVLTQTGKANAQFTIEGQPTEVELEVSQEAARFEFKRAGAGGGEAVSLGRMTAVLGAKVELTKVVGGRVVYLTCQPN